MDLGAKLRTLVIWALLRVFPYERLRAWHDAGRLRLVDLLLARGHVRLLSGLSQKLQLSTRHFPYWSAQALGFLSGRHELMVQEALRRSLPAGGVFIDVGANIGLLSLVGGSIVGASGRVIAIDAQRECVEAVRANARLNGLDNVEVLHAAAGATDGAVEVVITADSLWTRVASVGGHSLERRRDRISAVTLDTVAHQLNLTRVDVVKIDVEGAELEVIEGMQELLRRRETIVICEMHGKNAQFCKVMDGCGYVVENLDGPAAPAQAGANVHVICRPA